MMASNFDRLAAKLASLPGVSDPKALANHAISTGHPLVQAMLRPTGSGAPPPYTNPQRGDSGRAYDVDPGMYGHGGARGSGPGQAGTKLRQGKAGVRAPGGRPNYGAGRQA